METKNSGDLTHSWSTKFHDNFAFFLATSKRIIMKLCSELHGALVQLQYKFRGNPCDFGTANFWLTVLMFLLKNLAANSNFDFMHYSKTLFWLTEQINSISSSAIKVSKAKKNFKTAKKFFIINFLKFFSVKFETWVRKKNVEKKYSQVLILFINYLFHSRGENSAPLEKNRLVAGP